MVLVPAPTFRTVKLSQRVPHRVSSHAPRLLDSSYSSDTTYRLLGLASLGVAAALVRTGLVLWRKPGRQAEEPLLSVSAGRGSRRGLKEC